MEEQKVMVLESLPVIKEHFEKLSEDIKKKVDKNLSLICNEETVKTVKNARAELNKDFQALETERKQIKKAIEAKYNEFEKIYTEKIGSIYTNADAQLKEKINNVENELKQEKENELREFVEQHCKANNVEIEFERIGLNITLSASMKSLKDKAKSFIERVANDLKLIELEEYKDEILLEYQDTLDFANSKIKVVERHKRLDAIKKIEESQKEEKEAECKREQQIENIVTEQEEIQAPVMMESTEIEEEVEEEISCFEFKVYATITQARKLKEFLKEEGIRYE